MGPRVQGFVVDPGRWRVGGSFSTRYGVAGKLKNEEEQRFSKRGLWRKRGETPEKPYPREKFREGGNEEMRRKSANARKINRPRQLYQYKNSRERAIEEEKPYL